MEPSTTSSAPEMVVVVCCAEEGEEARAPLHARLLDAWDRELSRAPGLSLLFIDGRMRGPAASLAPKPWLRVLARPGLHRGALRNVALRETTAPLLLFLADDVIPAPGLLAAHSALHSRPHRDDVVGVGPVLFPRPLRADPFRRWLEDSGALFGVSFTCPDSRALASHFHGGNTSIPRRLLERTGPFREDFVGPVLDDDEMGRRLRALGVRFSYLPGAIGVHEHPVTFPERRRAIRGHGRAAARLDGASAPSTCWPTHLDRSTTNLYARAVWAAIRAAILPSDVRRGRYYRRLLAADFARGYREERAGMDPVVEAGEAREEGAVVDVLARPRTLTVHHGERST